VSSPVDRGLLRWTAVLFAVDLATWLLAWMWLDLSRVVSALAAWSALSLLVVCGLYLAAAMGARSGPFLKGERWPLLQPVLLPFRAVSVALYALARRLRSEEVVCEVMPGVYLGPRLFDRERARLEAQNVTVVFDLTSELLTSRAYSNPPFVREGHALLDRTFPSDADLDALVDRVLAHLREGRGVFIHCAFGRGRSALLACAVVLASGYASTADEALAKVKAARPAVSIRRDGVEVLRRFAARRAKANP
jgi:hypothetical protein